MQTLNNLFELIPSTLVPALVDAGVKSFALLALAGVVAFALRRASAATRHLVWFTTIVGLLLLPMLSMVLPSWQVLPRWIDAKPRGISPAAPNTAVIDQGDSFSTSVARPLPANAKVDSPEGDSSVVPVVSPPSDTKRFNVISLGPAMWLLGLLVTSAVPVLGAASLWRLGRVSSQIREAKWLQLLRGLLGVLGVRRRIALLQSRYRRMPMTWGVLRPRLLLPQEAEKWTEERRRVVLLHELAHVKRYDYFTNLMTQIACSLYWFNPLVWMAARRMAIERERACDDIVLNHGARPADYAEQILHIASDLPPDRWAAHGAIAVARRSSLESRLLAILDVRRNREGVTRLAVVISILWLAAAVCPLAIMRAADEKTSPANGDSVAFGPLVERRIYDPDAQKDDALLDLDSGKLFSEASLGAKQDSQSLLTAIDIFLKLVRKEKIDLMGDASGHSLVGLDMLLVRVPNEQLDMITPQALAREPRLDGGTQTEAEITPKELPATYLFKTRETGRGILQIIRFNKHESADIRYKMVQAQFKPVVETALLLETGKRFLTPDDGEFHDVLPTNRPTVHLKRDPRVGLCLVFNEIYNVPEEYERGIRVWNSMSAQQVVDAYREAGFALLPQERHGIHPIRKDRLPLTIFLPTMGFLQVTDLNDTIPSVNIRYKVLAAKHDEKPTRSEAARSDKPAEFSSLPEKPWTATGRVTDPEGKPLSDVEIWVHTGIGSLRRVATATTDADGRYSVSFGRGVLMAVKDSNLQIANVTAHKPGFFEKNLNRHGARAGALREVSAKDLELFRVAPEKMFLPGKPQTIDFVMAPAARIKGRLLGTGQFSNLSPREARRDPKLIAGHKELQQSPLAGWRVWLTGKELPPASSVLATATTDAEGNFIFESVPVGFEWQFQTETHYQQPEPKSPTFKLDSVASPFAFEIYLELLEKQEALRFLSGSPHSSRRRAEQSASSQQASEYTVRQGDTLALIVATLRGRGVDLSPKQLMEANSNVNWRRLEVGQKIVVPATASNRLDPSLRTGDSSVRVFSLKNADARAVAMALKELAPPASVEIDDRTNAVIVSGSKETVAAAAEIIRSIDIPRP